ncbi:endoplasmic reticulum lectin 1-like [Mya arenaria]|uniref:endoplasmic reticulum lectin 1-like n=1 Tax=Mya arenaria TaxID=6604 RepID=UPI0022E3816B|nr:endoplasmic reticulum lectin 1-like [Mya arenaria]
MLYFALLSLIPIILGDFNPFSDDDLYSINWAGPIDFDKLKLENEDLDYVSVQTAAYEKYQCVIPESQASIDASRKATYNGATPDELIQGLFSMSSCSYRIESYWTYELCHGKHVKQYHENKELGLQKPKLQEYYLGRMDKEEDKKTTKSDGKEETRETDVKDPEKQKSAEQIIKSIKLDGLDLPYYAVTMGGGSNCDVTGQPRKSHVMYICQPNGRGEIYQLKETSSCEYDIIVLTAVLCQHPAFKPKDPPVSQISCHSVEGSPTRPTRLTEIQVESEISLEQEENEFPSAPSHKGGTHPTSTPPQGTKPGGSTPQHVDPRPETKIGVQADKSLLRDFLAGDYCIHGGTGWWRHEFCYKKHAKQYHEDQNGDTIIYLGLWDSGKHLNWLQQNPGKRPKPIGQRKSVSMYYTNGDVCDLTGKPRFVEVKLKCLKGSNQPHAVSIYLVEPQPCEYVLGVESPLFCDILDKADDNGLLDHIEV